MIPRRRHGLRSTRERPPDDAITLDQAPSHRDPEPARDQPDPVHGAGARAGRPVRGARDQPERPAGGAGELRAKFGLDDPILVRYLRWLAAMAQGDWGFSFASRVDVDTLILQRVPTTLFVVGSSQILALAIALPVGIYAATRPYSVFDQIANTLAFVGFSLPTFFTGLLLILIFSIKLDWLPFVYRADIAATGWRWYWEHAPAGDHADHWCSACSRRPPIRATCARPCSTWFGSTMSPPPAPRA